MSMTDDELNAIEAAANSTRSPGPWEQPAYPSGDMVYTLVERVHVADCEWPSDAFFIAHSREWVPALVAEVRRMWPLVEALAALPLQYRDEHLVWYCPVCEETVNAEWGKQPYGMDDQAWAEQRISHAADCAREQAKALLAEREAE